MPWGATRIPGKPLVQGTSRHPVLSVPNSPCGKKPWKSLSKKYTPLHPAVVQARWEVEQLKGKIAALRQAAREESARGAANPSTSITMADLEPMDGETGEMRRLRGQVAAIDLEVVALKRESAIAVQTMDQIQRKVERLPQREQEMIALSRDYDNIKKSYEELLKKKLESQVSQKLEEKQKGEQFQVLEPASLPTQPSKPNRAMVLGFALLASLLIGVGGSFGLEMLDPTLRGSKEFKQFLRHTDPCVPPRHPERSPQPAACGSTGGDHRGAGFDHGRLPGLPHGQRREG